MEPSTCLILFVAFAFYSMIRSRRVGYSKRRLIALVSGFAAMVLLFTDLSKGDCTMYKYRHIVEFSMGIMISFLTDHKCDCCEIQP